MIDVDTAFVKRKAQLISRFFVGQIGPHEVRIRVDFIETPRAGS